MSTMKHVVFDLDDFAEQKERNCLKQLLKLKLDYPKLKVTLFAIPYYGGKSQKDFFNWIKEKYGDWIELAIHGWKHDSNFECRDWSKEQAIHHIGAASAYGCFVKGFKAPGWQISSMTYRVLTDWGYWVADHVVSIYTSKKLNKHRRPQRLKAYEIGHPWMVHGHTWNCEGNGIEELIEKGLPFNKETEFHFVSEVVDESTNS